MEIIKPTHKTTFHVPEGFNTLEQFIESVARVCYKSENLINRGSAPDFIRNVLLKRGHQAMIEHCVASVRFVADRGFTHELVRHRIASFAQESTRYCNYSKGKFNNSITVVAIPESTNPSQALLDHYQKSMVQCEDNYFHALQLGAKAQIARMFLPIGLKAEIVITANLREWLTIFGLRADSAAHPMMKSIMEKVLFEFINRVPCIFEK